MVFILLHECMVYFRKAILSIWFSAWVPILSSKKEMDVWHKQFFRLQSPLKNKTVFINYFRKYSSYEKSCQTKNEPLLKN